MSMQPGLPICFELPVDLGRHRVMMVQAPLSGAQDECLVLGFGLPSLGCGKHLGREAGGYGSLFCLSRYISTSIKDETSPLQQSRCSPFFKAQPKLPRTLLPKFHCTCFSSERCYLLSLFFCNWTETFLRHKEV